MPKLFEKIEILTAEDLSQLARMIDPRYVGKVVFECSVCPNPERTWYGDRGMLRHSYAVQQKLIDLGLADDDFFESIRGLHENYVILAIVLSATVSNLEPLFDPAMNMKLVDIYLYHGGRLVFKYD